ncbi:MAG: 50S ribosomal protein L25/general stress protein Ctc [Treponema sp. GWB1_62_6]|nr:MAG: 50S ribosomal protein L25/general stress protein Ctc [Treponema sp. GWA1_62_8]OHE68282.1 MAG: 50S ribosomal protein L25/general stress protein Ctc [Treponema sp. RIFOXYC1_FULL_61_9]OHE69324.1 MAG: 50S ribosomal protein L25/general stress protein Ctc [Treponema sp. GWC1_61_84]OHE70741.1 MAG: 50S ribosomal protein L25/general stress protein Ctc [Treponema sp. GWB1_62_6]HCM26262.1 50S ribosomal protein L25 [Treponema sp.]
MNQVVFTARKRVDTGSGVASRMRRAGKIPAVVYGRKGEAQSLELDALDFSKGAKGISESTIVKVDIDGKALEAFVKDTQRDILTGKVLHVDFYEVEMGRLLRAKVPVHLKGTALGTREGGILENPLHEIEVECFPQDLPEHIDVDISALKVNMSIHVRDLKLGDAVKILSNNDQVLALVKYAKAEEVVAEVAETVVAAAPVAGAAAAAAPAAPAAKA